MTNKFNVGDKVEFVESYGSYRKGDVVEVTAKWGNGQGVEFKGANGNGNAYTHRLNLFAPKQSKNQRITVLEKEIVHLSKVVNTQGELIDDLIGKLKSFEFVLAEQSKLTSVKPSTVVEEALANDTIEFKGKQYKKVDREAREGDVVIFRVNETDKEFSVTNKPYAVTHMEDDSPMFVGNDRTEFYVYADSHKRTPETVDVYELMKGYNPGIVMVDETPIETANQLRAGIIEKAKRFVEDLTSHINPIDNGYEQDTRHGKIKFDVYIDLWKTYFTVKNETREIIVVLKEKYGKRIIKETTKCAPGDVFNEHIGKAIALGRALGLDVSEFEQAVQPNEVVVGQVCEIFNWDGHNGQKTKISKVFDGGKANHSYSFGWLSKNNLTIINDTNAQYEVNK